MDISYLNLMTTDPSYNLAVEQYVFDELPRDRAYFMLWQNDNAIIIGKHQNTLAEINQKYVHEHGVRVVRRCSGGGAVYHDMGNLNYTFITDSTQNDSMNFGIFCEPVIKTLAQFGVHAELTGRNDMTIAGRKFSGNAQYVRDGRVMHHGTIMFSSNLSIVSQALTVDPDKIRSKGIASVRSRVTNIAEHLPAPISLSEFRSALLQNVLKGHSASEYCLTEKDTEAIDNLQKTRYGTWEWNYGKSPACTVHKSGRIEGCGKIEAYIQAEHGLITQISFCGDFFSLDEPDILARAFVGKRLTPGGIEGVLNDTDVSRYFVGATNRDVLRILSE